MVNKASQDRQNRAATSGITADAAYAGHILSGVQAMDTTAVTPSARPSTPAI